jgi:hypothetical protein
MENTLGLQHCMWLRWSESKKWSNCVPWHQSLPLYRGMQL